MEIIARGHAFGSFSLNHVGSALSSAWFAPCLPKNGADNLQNQSAAITPLCPPMQEAAHKRSQIRQKEMIKRFSAVLTRNYRDEAH